MLDAGIVDQDIDRTELAHDRFDHRVDVVRPAHVRTVEDDVGAGRGGDLLAQPFGFVTLPTAVERDPASFGREGTGDAEADAAGGAGNDSNLPVQHGALWPKTMARKTSRPTQPA